MVAHPHVQRVASLHMRRRVAQLPHSGDRRTGGEHEVCRCRRCNPICHALYCSEHVGTSTASADRMPDGGAKQRQRRRGEDGPSQQKRALIKPPGRAVGGRALYEQNCERFLIAKRPRPRPALGHPTDCMLMR